LSAITDSARGQDCQLRLPGVCNGNPETTVWAHSNSAEHGKGGALKAFDQNGCYACYACHMVYDRQYPRPAGLSLLDVLHLFLHAMQRSQKILVRRGLWDGVSDVPRSKKRPAKSRKIPVTGRSALQRMARVD